MNIVRTALLVLVVFLMPGGLLLLIPAIYRRLHEARK